MRFRKAVIVCGLVLTAFQSTRADDSLYIPRDQYRYADNPRYTALGGTPRYESEIQPVPVVVLGTVYAGMVIGLHINQRNAWWSNGSGDFHFIEDIEYARGLDKFGHFYTSFCMSTFSSDILMECGLDYTTSTWAGAGLGLAYTTYVEVEDGFAKNWGFSPSDAISNVVGASFLVAQNHVPFLQNFTPRWSFVPAEWTGDRTINERPRTFIDDYNSTTFWLAFNVNNLLPADAAAYWPDWLMVSLGYGIRNYAVNDENGVPIGVTRRYMIGLDYDWVKIIPPSSIGPLNYLRQALNYIRLPGPTLEIGDDGVKFGLLYPFAIVVPI